MAPLQVKDCPADVYQALRLCAQCENRSMAQQTVTILQEYLGLRPAVGGGWAAKERAQGVAAAADGGELARASVRMAALARLSEGEPFELPEEYADAAALLDAVRREDAQ